MRILSLLGSPRANGTTHSMARLIAGGLSGGGPVEEIALRDKPESLYKVAYGNAARLLRIED